MKKVFLWLILSGIFILGFVISYLGLTFSKIFVKKPAETSTPAPVSYSKATPAPITNPKGVFNLLFLGYGGAGHDGALLTDSIIIIHVDTNTGKAAFISIPRDLWIPGNRKINAEGSINGFQNVGGTIQNITGQHIDYFVSVDFGGFIKLVDDFGGVTVQVPVTFDDSFYPVTGQENNTCGITEDQINALKAKYSGYQLETQFTCRYEHLHFDKGSANLDGTTALKFVRSRHGDSDFARSLRQFAVLIGIENKLVSLKSLGKLDDTINTLSMIVKTDLTAGTIKTLLNVFGEPGKYKINQIQLTTANVLNEGKSSDGQYILTPKAGNFDFSGIKNYISSSLNN
ncbi:MAG TPA: LCP family protein [Candidatus Saccharimonadales bacterium]|nr:LCP family protein [Candidatus Saccharimonadales bacterium]